MLPLQLFPRLIQALPGDHSSLRPRLSLFQVCDTSLTLTSRHLAHKRKICRTPRTVGAGLFLFQAARPSELYLPVTKLSSAAARRVSVPRHSNNFHSTRTTSLAQHKSESGQPVILNKALENSSIFNNTLIFSSLKRSGTSS